MSIITVLDIYLMVVKTVRREEGKLLLLLRVISKLVNLYGYVLSSRNRKKLMLLSLRLLKRIVFAPPQGLIDPAKYQVLSQAMMRICSQLLLRVTRLQFLLNQRRKRNIGQAKNLGTVHCLMNRFFPAFRWRKMITTAMTGFLVQGGKRRLLPNHL